MTKTAGGRLMVIFLVLLTTSSVIAKQQSRLVTAQMRANALANIDSFEWAAAEQQAAIADAEAWVTMSDDELWEMVTSQELPRDIHTNIQVGCPNCGKGITPHGNYPWRAAGDWKLRCPNCDEVFPKNDFKAYYRSTLDEHGFFRRELGDASLLFNAEHPDPDDPLHKLYVNDGYGLTDEKGNRHRFIAYYNQWVQWAGVRRALNALARAYSLKSDVRYAHKATVLLDRIADVYPDMDFAPFHELGFEHSHGGTGKGRIQGQIWESGAAQEKAQTYDIVFEAIRDNTELVEFISRKAHEHSLGDKSTPEAIYRHIEDNLLLEFLESVNDGRIGGNRPRHSMTTLMVAIVLDRRGETEAWIESVFQPGFPGSDVPGPGTHSVPYMLIDGVDRDGMGGECGSYGLGWIARLVEFPGLMASYPEYTGHSLVAGFPKLKQCFLIRPRLMVLDAAMPPYGNSLSTGMWARSVTSPTVFTLGYKLYGDRRMADLAWHYARGNPQRLRLPEDIFEANPDALADEIARVAGQQQFRLRCEHLGRYGQLILQTDDPDAATGRAVWMVYGYGLGHRHADALNLGLYACNVDMLPDLGNPEYKIAGWASTTAWNSNTISHNTLVINDARQTGANRGGQITLFACEPPVRVAEVSAPEAYADVQAYRRTVALVDISDSHSYVLDVFRARGGTNHRLSYHGPAQTATVEGIPLASQSAGTFAAPDVQFAELPGDGETIRNTNGFPYLYDVERSDGPVASYYTVDWQAEDRRGRILEGTEPHLRLHALTHVDEVALASGDPAQNKPGNPWRLRYLIQSRLGEDMQSQFVTVLEPYDTTPFISRVRALQATHDADPNSVAAVAVEMADGTIDILISCEERTRVQVEENVEFDGRFGMIRLVDDQVRTMRMSDATLLSHGDVKLEADRPAYEGTVTAINADDPADHRVSLDPPLLQDADLVGRRIHFHNDVPKDTTYEITAETPDGISTGEITIIWGFRDRSDYSAGYRYLVNPGDRFVIPLHTSLDR